MNNRSCEELIVNNGKRSIEEIASLILDISEYSIRYGVEEFEYGFSTLDSEIEKYDSQFVVFLKRNNSGEPALDDDFYYLLDNSLFELRYKGTLNKKYIPDEVLIRCYNLAGGINEEILALAKDILEK
jgi:hypothetical protein